MLLFALLAASLSTAGVARAEGRPAYGGSAEGALAASPLTLDPLSPALGDEEVSALVFDTLFRWGADGRPAPNLALGLDETPAVPSLLGAPLTSPRARVHLRTDVRFSDGQPLTARDVAASLTRALASPRGWMLGPIRSARALSSDTVELELSRTAPDLALLLATPAASVTPGGLPPGAHPIGSGPFVVSSIARDPEGATVRLAESPTCFSGRPYLDTLTLRALSARAETTRLETGALALARHASSGFPGATRRPVALDASAPTLTLYLAFGRALPDDEAQALRAALDLGLDRARLVRQVREPARPALSAAPPALGGVEHPIAHDPLAARAQLVAKYPALSLALLIDRSRPSDRALAFRLLVELGHLGVTLSLDEVDAGTFARRAATGDYQLLLGTSAPPAPSGGLAELALWAAVDPQAARAQLARAPAQVGAVDLSRTRVLPLVHRGTRLQRAPELRGVAVDQAGRIDWPSVHWHR
jgi:MarR-like DNA-binding transcriptional regulator SgrR of sgrS sRNA